MNSSSYYAGKLQEFTNMKSQISNALSSVANCGESARGCMKYTIRMIVNRETFDKGELLKFSAALAGISADLYVISAECDSKIIKYRFLYQIASRLEKLQAEFDS